MRTSTAPKADASKRITGIGRFVRKNAVMLIALCAALVTMCIVPPDKAYLGYFDFKTLTCLFCVLAVVCALGNVYFLSTLARKVVVLFQTARMSVLALVYITFLGSMLIANDMALLTFLPLGYFVLHSTGKQKHMAFTFIMQNIAANLGGMLTPFGNPQNLYLYTKFTIPNAEFVRIMLPPFVFSVTLITLCCLLFVKPEPLSLDDMPIKMDKKRVALYLVLFALAIAIVFRGIPYWIGLTVIPLALLIADRRARLCTALYDCVFLRLCGQHGAHRCGAQFPFRIAAKRHAAVFRGVVPVHQQRAERDPAFAVHVKLSGAARRRQHRRRRLADRVARKPDHVAHLHGALSRSHAALYRAVLRIQFFLPCAVGRLYAAAAPILMRTCRSV